MLLYHDSVKLLWRLCR